MRKTLLPGFSALLLMMCTSCVAQKTPKLKADFIGFSDNVTLSYTPQATTPFAKHNPPFDLLTEQGNQNMKTAVLTLEQGSNTCALYALDLALDRIKYVQKHYMENDPDSKYYIVMLTDGLDNKSLTLAESKSRGRYESREAYGAALQGKMNEIMTSYAALNLVKSKSVTNTFQSYVLLYKGHDIKESGYTSEQLNEILMPYTGAQNTERPEPIQDEDLENLLEKFEGELISRSFSFNVQKDYAGKRIKMLFNDAEKESEQVYFEADLVRTGYEYELTNIETSPNFSIKVNPNYSTNNTALVFTVNDVRLNNASYKIEKNDVTQWVMDYGKFRKNSEYTAKTNTKKNAYIIVLLDASLSFQEKYADAQNAILEIIKMVEEL